MKPEPPKEKLMCEADGCCHCAQIRTRDGRFYCWPHFNLRLQAFGELGRAAVAGWERFKARTKTDVPA